MAKQENFNFESVKHNKISLFLSRFIFNGNMDILRKSGFIDSYIKDKNIDQDLLLVDSNTRLLFLLFKNNKMKMSEIIEIIKELSVININIRYSYELINNYFMIVVDFPKEFNQDYDNVIKGRYSKLSEDFKKAFPQTEDVVSENKVRMGKRYTIYHHIFERTEWLQNFWMQKLGLIELDYNLELWGRPLEADLEFDIEELFKSKK